MDSRGEWAYTEGQGRDNKRHVEHGRSSAGSYAAAARVAHGMDREGRACGGKNEQETGSRARQHTGQARKTGACE